MVKICFYSILVSFFCLGVIVFIATYLILREKLLYNNNDIKKNFDKYLRTTENEERKYEWYEHDFMTYFDDLKYDEFVSDMGDYFENVLTNFDIINYELRGD